MFQDLFSHHSHLFVRYLNHHRFALSRSSSNFIFRFSARSASGARATTERTSSLIPIAAFHIICLKLMVANGDFAVTLAFIDDQISSADEEENLLHKPTIEQTAPAAGDGVRQRRRPIRRSMNPVKQRTMMK
jgi:hypothetical protein